MHFSPRQPVKPRQGLLLLAFVQTEILFRRLIFCYCCLQRVFFRCDRCQTQFRLVFCCKSYYMLQWKVFRDRLLFLIENKALRLKVRMLFMWVFILRRGHVNSFSYVGQIPINH